MLDRKLFKLPFTRTNIPHWPCPRCKQGILRLKDDADWREMELANSRDHSHEAWEPEWISYVYSCLLRCSIESCDEVVSSSGTGRVDATPEFGPDGEPDLVWSDYFSPSFFEPFLPIFNVPVECPESVQKAIFDSFRLFFSSPNAAANCVRIAVEDMLTDLGVPRFLSTQGKAGKPKRMLSLHTRIQKLPAKHQSIQDMLMAMKWLGNHGSHSGNGLTVDDVLDLYEFAEHIFTHVYAPAAPKLLAKAKKVNKKKGPLTK